jgi:hypothetical protein
MKQQSTVSKGLKLSMQEISFDLYFSNLYRVQILITVEILDEPFFNKDEDEEEKKDDPTKFNYDSNWAKSEAETT